VVGVDLCQVEVVEVDHVVGVDEDHMVGVDAGHVVGRVETAVLEVDVQSPRGWATAFGRANAPAMLAARRRR
jgi:hypothetical protein